MAAGGKIRLEITCADVLGFLEKLTKEGISLRDVEQVDALTIVCSVSKSDFTEIGNLAEKCGNQVKIHKKYGISWALLSVFHRPVLIIGLALILVCFWFLPGRVLILEVEGNTEIPCRQILEAAENCGIRFGVSTREVRSEKMKNALLHQLPQLQWAGINTYGSRAVITVRERKQEVTRQDGSGVSSIVAGLDGVILSCTTTKGNCLIQPGQAVQAGQVLISGYTDLGLCISATEAEGEILAQTKRIMTAKMPSEICMRTEKGRSKTKYSLIIGKKRINFYKGSGISDISCVKMYYKYVLTLPGGFVLPVSLIKETETETVLENNIRAEDSARGELSRFSAAYLRQVMISGCITGKSEAFSSEDAYTLEGQYQCQEMIGRVKPERIGEVP